jgi:hypothetical protein
MEREREKCEAGLVETGGGARVSVAAEKTTRPGTKSEKLQLRNWLTKKKKRVALIS